MNDDEKRELRKIAHELQHYIGGTSDYGDELIAKLAPLSAQEAATEAARVEIGGQVMTVAQFEAARYPLLNAAPPVDSSKTAWCEAAEFCSNGDHHKPGCPRGKNTAGGAR